MNEKDKCLKISVITMHAVQNYGSVLQAYATQEMLKEHNMDVKIINYVRENCRDENLMYSWTNGNVIKKIVIYPTIKRWEKIFGGFRKEYLNLTKTIYTYQDDFQNLLLDADIYCTGSDQVWNSKWNQGIEYPLYLSFAPENSYKISFASSFGVTRLEEWEIEATKKYIQQYRFVSVREEEATKIIKEQYGYENVYQLVDPTLMLTADEWKRFSLHDRYRGLKDEYILIYNLNRSREFDEYAKKLAKKAGLRLIRLCTRFDQFYRCGKSIIIPNVKDFVNLIANAKYVITDSFHATAFSMNMGVEPICIYPKDFGSRLDSFLKLTQSYHRRVKEYSDFDILNRPVDFEMVNTIINEERERCNEYIDMIIRDFYKQQEGIFK